MRVSLDCAAPRQRAHACIHHQSLLLPLGVLKEELRLLEEAQPRVLVQQRLHTVIVDVFLRPEKQGGPATTYRTCQLTCMQSTHNEGARTSSQEELRVRHSRSMMARMSAPLTASSTMS
jgi:hypothetical protein